MDDKAIIIFLELMIAYLLLGSNIEPREEYLSTARKLIAQHIGDIEQKSALYGTAAWGNENQADFLNQAVKVETQLNPLQMLKLVKEIETLTGRKDREHWGAREIDIDILLFGETIFEHKLLQIPHPQLQNRRFALTPLEEIAGDIIHPFFHKSIAKLLAECSDDKPVSKLTAKI